ncbi:MAG: 16S rRNA (uracil(1498)-N(3))-methyltransferase [Desulfovibrio sp.]|jgi:16S rRNA (uracil1498-N3)-methyltransferase|nr:16S rRNA (uracil(1498)-N(3))-methyltransferase [Desulfovibrio sp.]
MDLHRFYLPPASWGDEVILDKDQSHHLSTVLRLHLGSEAVLLDGKGRSGRFEVTSKANRAVRLRRIEETFVPKPDSLAVMAIALSHAVRSGFFFEKAVELGADTIWLWRADYSQGKLAPNVPTALERRLQAGAKQCGNPWIPEIANVKDVDGVVAACAPDDRLLLPWESQEGIPLLTPDMAGRPGRTVYVVGPEGGFSPRELETLQKKGFTPFSLGTRVLRCETAAMLCLGLHWWASHLPRKGGS